MFSTFQRKDVFSNLILYFCSFGTVINITFLMEKPKGKSKRFKIILSIAAVLLLIIISAGIYIYNTIFEPFDNLETVYIYIDEENDYDQVVSQLQEKASIPDERVFHLLADRMNYPNRIKTGRYAIEPGMNMPDVIRLLRSGVQVPVNLTFNNIRTKENLAVRLSEQLMIDSLTILKELNDTALAERYGFNNQTFGAMFIPNTYQVYWDTSIESLLNRMKREYDAFWNDVRKGQAEKIGLTPVEVSTLASIVEEEATYSDEYATVAGLYLNRIKRGMRLEADPTVKFAVGDHTLRRILFKHLEVESPYNTYKNDGLPPGPIRIPSIQGIDAVLSPATHNYLFMCAKEDLSGRHNFAVTHAEHARNARAYQRALNERRIY